MSSDATPALPPPVQAGAAPSADGLPAVKEDQAGEAAAEGKLGNAMIEEAPVAGKQGEGAKVEGQDAPKGQLNDVPKPQAAPMNKRPNAPPPAGHYDLISELNPRCEAHIPIPLKSYPEIPWRLVLCGFGPGPSPLTEIERETGAAVLVRTIQRTIHRKPSAPVGTQTREQQITAELRRLETALAAARKAEAAAAQAEAPPSPNASNIPVPPSPGISENNLNPMFAGNDLGFKAAVAAGLRTDGNLTPDKTSPEQSKVEAVAKSPDQAKTNGLQVVIEGGDGAPPTPDEAGAVDHLGMVLGMKPGEIANLKKEGKAEKPQEMIIQDEDKEPTPGEKAAERADDVPIPGPPEPSTEAAPKPSEPKEVKPEIGIRCWIIGASREEVDDAADACRDLIGQAIQEYEDAFEDISDDDGLEGIDELGEAAENSKIPIGIPAKLPSAGAKARMVVDPVIEPVGEIAAKALMT